MKCGGKQQTMSRNSIRVRCAARLRGLSCRTQSPGTKLHLHVLRMVSWLFGQHMGTHPDGIHHMCPHCVCSALHSAVTHWGLLHDVTRRAWPVVSSPSEKNKRW